VALGHTPVFGAGLTRSREDSFHASASDIVGETDLASTKSGEYADASPGASGADIEAQRLSEAIGRGDETAFEELYDRYQDRMFRLVLVLGHGDETLAWDVVQLAMVTAARKLRRVETEAHLWQWLARVARQHLIKEWRRRAREPILVSVRELADTPSESSVDRVLEEQLDSALLALPEQDRQVVEWFYFDDLSFERIGERLGISPKAVSSRLERLRAKLREALIPNGPTGQHQ
jgi:RNA polymerase sigma-70 factor (ECF subfamily)